MSNDHNHLVDVGVEVKLDLIEFVEIRVWREKWIFLAFETQWVYCRYCSDVKQNPT